MCCPEYNLQLRDSISVFVLSSTCVANFPIRSLVARARAETEKESEKKNPPAGVAMEEAEPVRSVESDSRGEDEVQRDTGEHEAVGEESAAPAAVNKTAEAHEKLTREEDVQRNAMGAESVEATAAVHAPAAGAVAALPAVSEKREPKTGGADDSDRVQEHEEQEEPVVRRENAASSYDEQRALEMRAREMELFQDQLEKEMLKRRPDHFIIGVICRSLNGVPDHMRSSVWKEILGVTRSERLYLDQSISRVEEDLENQKVISADAFRTRGHDAYFKQPETVELITKLLTYYCKCRNIRYKQGMNEVLAPFLILERDPPMPEGVVFQCFYAMIDKFLPHVFIDREFKSLQCSFQLYRLLMLYHDPKLCHYLDQHDMTPELYVTPWFMTLFARNLQPELVFLLWDFFLLEEHPFLMHFIAYAMVDANKEKILSAEIAMLPQVLSSITFGSKSELEAICESALHLAQTTPRSFERDLYSVCYGGFNDSMLPFMRQISGASSLQVYSDELVANLLKRISAKAASLSSTPRPSKSKRDEESLNPLLSPLSRTSSFSTERNASASSVFFIVLDCRPIEQYRECHLSLSYHIDPEVVGSPDALSVLIKGFSRMKGCHFCFVGPSDPSSNASKSSNIAFNTISRLARGISGERKPQVETQAPPASAPAVLNFPTSPGVPGAGANDIISKEGAANGNRKLHFEHISVTRLVLMFLQKGFEHISRLDGGFEELKKEIMSMDTFTQEQLLVHAEPPAPAPTSTSSGFKLFSKIGLARLRSTQSDDMITIEATHQEPPTTTSSVTSSTDSTLVARPKAKVTSLSQRFQSFTAAAKDAVSQGTNSSSSSLSRLRSKSSPDLTSPVSEGMPGELTDERQLVGEEEWVEVCLRTREALEKSLAYKEVVFQTGSMGILLQKSNANKKYQAVVDSIVPESQASESQQMDRGDLLVSVNGQSMENVPFLSVIDLVKDAKRPVVLRFQNPNAKKALDSFDAISIPPMAPTLVSASHHSIGITWSKLSLPNIRYHLQYAKQSEFNFNPWVSVVMKQDGSSDLSASGITEHTNGTMVGLDPGQSFVFRVRCGDGEKWGPYSLSSNPICTLEKSVEESADDEAAEFDSFVKEEGRPICSRPNTDPVFLPGSCPVFVERGLFYYKVIIGLRARKRPVFDADKLDVVVEKGSVIKCTERMIAPGTNQIFVRIASDDACLEDQHDTLEEELRLVDSGEEDDVGAWAFENTPEGTVVLERLPEEPVPVDEPAPAAAILLQEQAKSMVSSIFSANSNGAKSSAGSTSSNETLRAIVVAPKILQVFPISSSSIVVTWDPVNDVGVTKYQIQYSKNRLTAMWWNANQEIEADTLKYIVNDLTANTAYLFRIRGFSSDSGWGPYSESSENCKTLPVEVEVKEAPKSESVPAASEIDDTKDEQPAPALAPASSLPAGDSRTGSGNLFRLPVGSIFSAPSTTSSSGAPLRTGSTFLDKAVAAASRLTLSRRRSLSSTSATSSSVSAMAGGQESDEQEVMDDEQDHDQMIEEVNGITYVNLGHWKRDANGSFQDFRFYTVSQYNQSGDNSSSIWEAGNPTSSNLEKVGERDLVVTPTSLFVLNSWVSKREGYAVLEHSRMLESLVKITTQKSVKNLIVFHFKSEKFTESADTSMVPHTGKDADAATGKQENDDVAQEEETAVTITASTVDTDRLYFVVNDPDACVGLVREYFEQLLS